MAKSSIEISSLADHGPVIVQLRPVGTQKGRRTWRLNEDLIQDIEVEEKIKAVNRAILFSEWGPGVSRATIWEAHKAYIRGILISIGDRKNKDGARDMERTIK